MTAIQTVSRIQARHDQEQEADCDREAQEDAGDDDLSELGADMGERLRDREVCAPVAHVADCLDERSLEPEGAGDAEEHSDDDSEPAQDPGEQDPEKSEGDEDDERDRQEVLPVGLVEAPGFAEDAAERIHARELTRMIGRTAC